MKPRSPQPSNAAELLSGPEVQVRYRRSHVTIWRWTRDHSLGFPAPLRINGYKYWRLSDLEAWENSLVSSESER